MPNKVFISHSAEDKDIVEAVIDLLHGGMDIKKSEIFCTSLSGSLTIGEEFIGRIRREINECEVVIFLLSEAYMDSFFCNVECGAAWALGKNIKPVLIPPLTFPDLKKPIDGNQAIMINDERGIAQLYDELKAVGVAAAGTDDFINHRKLFLDKIRNLTAVQLSEEDDINGIVEIKVTEIYKPEDNKFLKIEKRIDKELLRQLESKNLDSWEKEEHWLDNQFHKIRSVKEGDRLKIKVTGSKYYSSIIHGEKKIYNVRNIYFSLLES